MTVIKNNKCVPASVKIGNQEILIDAYSEYEFNADTASVEMIVSEGDNSRPNLIGYILLAVFGLIGILLDFADSYSFRFNKVLSLPVKVILSDADKDATVEIVDSILDGYFCDINSNTDVVTELIIDDIEIDRQYKAHQKECFALLFVPFLLLILLSVFILLSKNVIAYLILAVIIAIAYWAWYSNHRINRRFIKSFKDRTK